MPRPQKSTLNRFVDEFCEFTLESQEKALDLMQFEHRRAQIRAKKEPAPSQRVSVEEMDQIHDGWRKEEESAK